MPGNVDRPGNGIRPGSGDRPNIGNRPNVGDRVNIGNINVENNVNSIRNRWSNVNTRPFGPNYWANRPATLPTRVPGWRWQGHWGRYPAGWCWRPASWAAFGTWFAWSWATPIPYNYGSNVVYQDNSVYVNEQPVATTEVYYEQAETIAQSVPEDAQPDDVEWMPLGVFAVTEQTAADSGMLVQLAVSKEGIIAGTFYNDTTDDGRPLQGMVDRQTQRAAWQFADGKNEDLVMETGIYNLTQDHANALVHFGPDNTQTWLMVRLPDPEQGQ